MTSALADVISPAVLPTDRRGMRVAWLFPMMRRTHYWQPVFREFARLVPDNTVFVGCWGGFASGYEGTFKLRVMNGGRAVMLKNKEKVEQYDSAFYWAPLSVVGELARFRPDVIFTTGFSAWTMCALLQKRLTGCKVVMLWDGNSAHWKSQISQLRHMQRRMMAPFFDFVISNMREGVEYMQQELRIPAKKLLSHPYQVADPAILDSSSTDKSMPGKRPIFLFVGSIDSRKGWRYLLEAARILVEQGVDQFSVVLVGAGPQQEDLRARITDYGLQEVAFYLGPVPYHGMASCYRQADVFVFPTMDDVWGLVLVEAMTFGKPVICSQFAGAREMVAHGENGFIVNPRDVKSFASYMRKFIDDPGLTRQFGSHSQNLMTPYTPKRAAEVLAAVALKTCEANAAAACQTTNQLPALKN